MEIDPEEWANDDELMTTEVLAKKTKTSRSFWDKARVRGDGPPYILIGNRPRYPSRTTQIWLIARTIRSTSQRGRK